MISFVLGIIVGLLLSSAVEELSNYMNYMDDDT